MHSALSPGNVAVITGAADGIGFSVAEKLQGMGLQVCISDINAEKLEQAARQQVADFMVEHINQGDFYILCPDNDTTREMDNKRIEWAAGDLIHNRPALSRWHKDYEQVFEDFQQD